MTTHHSAYIESHNKSTKPSVNQTTTHTGITSLQQRRKELLHKQPKSKSKVRFVTCTIPPCPTPVSPARAGQADAMQMLIVWLSRSLQHEQATRLIGCPTGFNVLHSYSLSPHDSMLMRTRLARNEQIDRMRRARLRESLPLLQLSNQAYVVSGEPGWTSIQPTNQPQRLAQAQLCSSGRTSIAAVVGLFFQKDAMVVGGSVLSFPFHFQPHACASAVAPWLQLSGDE